MEFLVPQFDPVAEYEEIQSDIDAAISGVLHSGQFINGTAVREFEQAFGKFLDDSRHVAGVNSGTDALILALRALDIGPGHEVIVPANTFTATVMAVEAVGADPVLADVDQALFVLTPELARPLITKRTACIIPVHLYGHPCPMPGLVELAKENGLKVLEDAAQAHGAEVRERPVGTFGDAAAFSFYPSKNLGAYGDAGAVVGNQQIIHDVKMLRNLGRDTDNRHMIPGVNSRLDALQAAILRVKLKRMPVWLQRRREVAARYDEALSGYKVGRPRTADWAEHAFHLYVVRLSKRDQVYENLRDRGIEVGVHYPVPIHLQPAHQGRVQVRVPLQTSEELASQLLSLPIYPQMTRDLQDKVVDSLVAAL